MMRASALVGRLMVPAMVALIAVATLTFFLDPGLGGAARAAHFVQAALILAVAVVFHRAHLRQVRSIEGRLEELRRHVQMLRAANENGRPRAAEPPAA